MTAEGEEVVVVEVEFADIGTAREFVPPDWFGEEITGSTARSNRELAACHERCRGMRERADEAACRVPTSAQLRDLGGYRASDSRTVPWQALYRSDSLGKLQGADWERFLGLGICTVIDLRYPWEIEAKGRVPEPERFHYVDLSIEHRPYD